MEKTLETVNRGVDRLVALIESCCDWFAYRLTALTNWLAELLSSRFASAFGKTWRQITEISAAAKAKADAVHGKHVAHRVVRFQRWKGSDAPQLAVATAVLSISLIAFVLVAPRAYLTKESVSSVAADTLGLNALWTKAWELGFPVKPVPYETPLTETPTPGIEFDIDMAHRAIMGMYPHLPSKNVRFLMEVALEEGVDPLLVAAVAMQESRFRHQGVRSHAGAYGILQLMHFTARELEVNRFILEENIRGGARYLRKHLEDRMFQRKSARLALVLSAYNAGPGTTKYVLKTQGRLPNIRETRDYIKNVTRYYREFCAASKQHCALI